MRPYEIMIILDAGLEEDAIRGVLDRTTKLISDAGGTVGKVDRWGRRRFAYEVNHRAEGYYVVVETTTEPAVVADVDRVLGLADEVIRHKVIRLPEKVAGRARTGSSAPTPVAAAPEGSAPEGSGRDGSGRGGTRRDSSSRDSSSRDSTGSRDRA